MHRQLLSGSHTPGPALCSQLQSSALGTNLKVKQHRREQAEKKGSPQAKLSRAAAEEQPAIQPTLRPQRAKVYFQLDAGCAVIPGPGYISAPKSRYIHTTALCSRALSSPSSHPTAQAVCSCYWHGCAGTHTKDKHPNTGQIQAPNSICLQVAAGTAR